MVQLADIASAQQIPPTFLSKIFQKLARHGLLRSHRGSLRGYSLGRAAEAISLREILNATEGPDLFDRCAFWHDICGGDVNPCVLHEVWKKSTALLQEEVETLTLADLAHRWHSTATRPVGQVGLRGEVTRLENGTPAKASKPGGPRRGRSN